MTKNDPPESIEVLQARLKEAEETLSAIQRGEVDAVVVDSPDGKKVFTLQGADYLYRLLIQEMHDAAIVISDTGTILFCNQYFSDMLKTPLTALIGSSLSTYVLPEDREEVSTLSELLDSRGLKAEVRFLTSDGAIIPATASFTRIQEANGICIVVTDLSVQKRIEDRLRREYQSAQAELVTSQKRYQALTETIADFIWEIDVDGAYTYCSPQMETLWGLKPEKMIGKTPYDMMPPEARKQGMDMFRRMRESPATFTDLETTGYDSKGHLIYLETSGVPFFDDHGNLSGYRGVTRDITERKGVEKKLRESEERFRELAEKAGSIILRFDTMGRITYFNEFAEKFFGFSREEIIGKPAVGTIIPATESITDRDLNAMVGDIVARPELYAENENENIKRNGERVWIRWTNKPVFNTDGTIREFTTIGIDITDRKNTEDALRDLMARYELILEGAHTALWDWDVLHKTVVYSPQWKALRGYGEDEISNQDDEWSKGIHPDDIPQVMSAIKEHFEGNTPVFAMEYRVQCKDGSWKWIFDRGIAKRDAQGVVVRMAGSEEDITERKATEGRLQQYVENLKRSNEDLERFAYIASHDLQEPLRNVVSFSQLLSRRYQGKLGTDADEYIGYITEGGKRMQVLVQDLLEYSRVNTRGHAFEIVSCDEILDQALQNLQTAIQENDALIEMDSLPTVRGDRTQLTLVFQNLVGNAIKFRRREIQPHIRISADRKDDGWTFAIKDNGIGIDSAYYDRIFVIFQRLHGWNEYPGTGVGLAIVKKIIERHGGRIWVESTMGNGSTFYFTLPEVPTLTVSNGR